MYHQNDTELTRIVDQCGANYIQGLTNMGKINTFFAQQLLAAFRQNIDQIAIQLTQKYASRSITGMGIEMQTVEHVVRQWIGEIAKNLQMQQQPQQTLFGQNQQFQNNSVFGQTPPGFGNNQNFGGRSFIVHNQTGVSGVPPLNDSTEIPTPAAAAPEPKVDSGKMQLVTLEGPVFTYSAVQDSDPAKYSIVANSGTIMDVLAKATITDNVGDTFNYSSVHCHVCEPGLFHVINGFSRNSQGLCSGNWFSNIQYNRFVLKENRLPKSVSPIDLTSFAPEFIQNHSVEEVISNVVKSIIDRDYAIVDTLKTLIVQEMCSLMRQHLRHSSDVSLVISIDDLDDIIQLPTIRDRQFGDVTYHRDYENTVLKCFKKAVTRVITDLTMSGFFATKDIVANMIACPSFTVRAHGIYDREMETCDKDFIEAVSAKYTAFARDGEIVVANFIPKQLRTDLNSGNYAARIGDMLSVFDYAITKLWNCQPKTIFMKEANDVFVATTGITIDGIPFIYSSDINIYEGLEAVLPF